MEKRVDSRVLKILKGVGDLETYWGDDFIKVSILTDNSSIISTQLERHPLQGFATAFHYLFPNCDGASEAYFVNVRMSGTEWSQVVPAAERLDYTWRKELNGQLYQLEAAIRSIGRRLDDNGVPGIKRRRYLPPCQQ